jgi:hypothetical protein
MSIVIMVWPVGGAKYVLFFGYNFGTGGRSGVWVGVMSSPYGGICDKL